MTEACPPEASAHACIPAHAQIRAPTCLLPASLKTLRICCPPVSTAREQTPPTTQLQRQERRGRQRWLGIDCRCASHAAQRAAAVGRAVHHARCGACKHDTALRRDDCCCCTPGSSPPLPQQTPHSLVELHLRQQGHHPVRQRRLHQAAACQHRKRPPQPALLPAQDGTSKHAEPLQRRQGSARIWVRRAARGLCMLVSSIEA